MDDGWHKLIRGAKQGPDYETQLKRLFAFGVMWDETLTWKEEFLNVTTAKLAVDLTKVRRDSLFIKSHRRTIANSPLFYLRLITLIPGSLVPASRFLNQWVHATKHAMINLDVTADLRVRDMLAISHVNYLSKV